MEVCRRRRVGNRPIANTNRLFFSSAILRVHATRASGGASSRVAAKTASCPSLLGNVSTTGSSRSRRCLCALDTTTVGAKNWKDRAACPRPARGCPLPTTSTSAPAEMNPQDETPPPPPSLLFDAPAPPGPPQRSLHKLVHTPRSAHPTSGIRSVRTIGYPPHQSVLAELLLDDCAAGVQTNRETKKRESRPKERVRADSKSRPSGSAAWASVRLRSRDKSRGRHRDHPRGG